MEIRQLFDGEMHEVFPGDWKPASQKVVDWVATEGQEHLALETPDLNWVISDLSPSEQRMYGVEGGWSTFACMLQALSRALGGSPKCFQKGKRYFFQHNREEN